MDYIVSDAGAALAMEFEGFEPAAYLDMVGVPTIGYGLTRWFGRPGKPRVQMGETIDRETAFQELVFTLQSFWDEVENRVMVPLEQYQVDALASFIYNVGTTAFLGSTMLRKLNNGDFEGAANEFQRWNKAGGQVVRGLTRRRAAEEALFRGATR
ncbi:endolysin [Acidovorax phage ACP17]|uniref:Endolysin n=1 Tax=Acidovorax phage ACP17 TaxID=2010329 RepID=A0A218M2W9_9CAUD|nr:endolysin [Acidovorax phage ACP17]ASD50380.1 lysin [Acidovorax phage ACP17]